MILTSTSIGHPALKVIFKPLMSTFIHRSTFPVSPATLFKYHEQPGAFERLNPPWQPVKVLSAEGGIRDGATVSIRVPILGPIGFNWHLEHRNFIADKQFQDVQVRGPFVSWQHTHTIAAAGEGSELIDEIKFKFPGGPLGELINTLQFKHQLQKLFIYRHAVTKNDLAVIAAHGGARKLRVLVSGASGLVGTALCSFLTVAGHEVSKLVRKKPANGSEIFWDPDAGVLDESKVEGFDAWINLSGENVAGGRWSEEFKRKLFSSRVNTTGLLARTMRKISQSNPALGPAVFISASAVGIYGQRDDEILTEDSAPGADFLADVARRWEDEALVVSDITRVVTPRFGIILSARGGALQKMLLPFKCCVGGVIGSGNQFMSWITLDDVVYGIYHALMDAKCQGALNFVAGEPVRNAQFVSTLGRVLHRPAIFPLPAFVVRTIFGEMGERLLLGSLRVSGQGLKNSGYECRYNKLEDGLRHVA